MKKLIEYINENINSFLFETKNLSDKKELILYARTHPGENFEAGGKCCWFDNAKDFIDKVGHNKLKRKFGENYIDIIKNAYEYVLNESDDKKITYENVPFFCSTSNKSKINTIYIHRNPDSYIIDLIEDNNINIEQGTCCSFSGSGGVDFEVLLTDDIKKYIKDPNDKSIKYKSICDKLFTFIGKSKTIEILSKKDDLSDYVLNSGKGKTNRNEFNQIINKDTLKVNVDYNKKDEKILNNVLKQSGKIISDITITTDENFNKSDINNLHKNDIYLSLKDMSAQLSSISLQQPFYGDSVKNKPDSVITNSLKDKISWEKIKDNTEDTSVEAFKNLCDLFGFDYNEVYEHFLNPTGRKDIISKINYNNNDKDFDLENANNVISALVHLLIGGNYYYVNSNGTVKYIDWEYNEIPFIFKSSGKGYLDKKLMSLEGTIKSKKDNSEEISCILQFRSSGRNFKYPYRLFMKITDNHYIDKLFN